MIQGQKTNKKRFEKLKNYTDSITVSWIFLPYQQISAKMVVKLSFRKTEAFEIKVMIS